MGKPRRNKWDYAGRDLITINGTQGSLDYFVPDDSTEFTSGDLLSPLLTFADTGCFCGESTGQIVEIRVTEKAATGQALIKPDCKLWLLTKSPTLPAVNSTMPGAVGDVNSLSVLAVVTILGANFVDVDTENAFIRMISTSVFPINYVVPEENANDEIYGFLIIDEAVTFPTGTKIYTTLKIIKD